MAPHQRTVSGEARVAHIVHHPEYYINGGDLTFLVENYLFRVHRYFFERESPYFQVRLVTPASPGQVPVGSSDSNAFTLDSVSSVEFARFLWVFYNPKYSLYDTTLEEWISILRLAHEWSFAEVKNLVVRQLEKMEMENIQKIEIYHQYDIDKAYLIPAYSILCTREQPLEIEEAERLGMKTVVQIARARECARGKPTGRDGARSPTFADLETNDLIAVVRDVFDIPAPVTEGANGHANPDAQTSTPPAANGTQTQKGSGTANGTADGGTTNGNASTTTAGSGQTEASNSFSSSGDIISLSDPPAPRGTNNKQTGKTPQRAPVLQHHLPPLAQITRPARKGTPGTTTLGTTTLAGKIRDIKDDERDVVSGRSFNSDVRKELQVQVDNNKLASQVDVKHVTFADLSEEDTISAGVLSAHITNKNPFSFDIFHSTGERPEEADSASGSNNYSIEDDDGFFDTEDLLFD